MKQIIEDLKAVDKQLSNEGFAQNTFVRRTLLNSIDALNQHDGKPLVSGSLPPDYWQRRCALAEKFIEESPCDPDITKEQVEAWAAYNYFLKKYSGNDC